MTHEDWFRQKLESFNNDVDFRTEQLVLDVTEQVAAAMEALHIDRAELARRMNIPEAHVTNLLKGDSEIFTLKTMAALSDALGTDLTIRFH